MAPGPLAGPARTAGGGRAALAGDLARARELV